MHWLTKNVEQFLRKVAEDAHATARDAEAAADLIQLAVQLATSDQLADQPSNDLERRTG